MISTLEFLQLQQRVAELEADLRAVQMLMTKRGKRATGTKEPTPPAPSNLG